MRWVFGYGSLMYEPEWPEHVAARRVGRVAGWRRRFNKRSVTRGCPESVAVVPEGLADWVRDGQRLSMVLGTEPAPGEVLWGELLGYPDEREAELLERLGRREGSGYRQVSLEVETDEGVVTAWSWFTRPESELVVDLSLDDIANVLHRAMPQVEGPRALGARYLLEVERHLRGLGVPDPGITALADRVRALQAGSAR